MGKCIVLGVLLCLFQAEPTGSIEGTVREQDGTVAPGIQVALLNLTADGPILRETVTDEEGRYAFDGLAPGSYVVEHELGLWFGAATFARPVPEICAGLRPDEAGLYRNRFRLQLQEKLAEHPFRHEVASGSKQRQAVTLPEHVPVTIQLRGANGPVAGALVMLLPLSLEAMRAWPPTIGSPDSRTDETGTITFPRIRLDRYCPVFRIGDWDIVWKEQEVGAAALDPLVVELGPYSVRVKILDARGTPISCGQPVILRDVGFPRIGMWPNLVLEARDGWLEVPYAVAGDYTVDAIAGSGNGTARTHVMVRPDLPHSEATLRMPPMGSIVVRLKSPRGTGERRVGIQIRQQGQDWNVAQTSPCPGEVRFDHLVEGTYLVGEHAGPAWLPFRGDPVEVEVKAFETVEVTLVVPEQE